MEDEVKYDAGSMPANKGTVIDYLVETYGLKEAAARVVVEKEDNAKIIKTAEELSSFAYYPGDKIARNEGLIP